MRSWCPSTDAAVVRPRDLAPAFSIAPGLDAVALYGELLENCVDGVMTAYPSRFERCLRVHDIVRPGRPGVDPCI